MISREWERTGLEKKIELLKSVRKRQTTFVGHVYRNHEFDSAALTPTPGRKRYLDGQRLTHLPGLSNTMSEDTRRDKDLLKTEESCEDWRQNLVDVCKRPGT